MHFEVLRVQNRRNAIVLQRRFGNARHCQVCRFLDAAQGNVAKRVSDSEHRENATLGVAFLNDEDLPPRPGLTLSERFDFSGSSKTLDEEPFSMRVDRLPAYLPKPFGEIMKRKIAMAKQ